MDPLDEFEFKPITEGLGFHKKAVTLKDEIKKSGISASLLGAQIPSHGTPDEIPRATQRRTYEDLLAALEKPIEPKKTAASAAVTITEPLPREKKPQDEPRRSDAATFTVDVGFKLPNMNLSMSRSASNSPPPSPLVPAAVSISSAMLDLMVVTALTLIFLLSVLMITKVDLFRVFSNTQSDTLTQLSLLVLFVTVMQMYVVICRSLFGATLGEWTFDHQIGTEQDQKKALYPLRVIWRSLLVTMTGVLFLPLLSWVFGKDLSAKLTGLQLYRQRY